MKALSMTDMEYISAGRYQSDFVDGVCTGVVGAGFFLVEYAPVAAFLSPWAGGALAVGVAGCAYYHSQR